MQDKKMKPEYKFLKNFAYARSGFWEVLKNETSFKLEIVFFVLLSLTALFLPYPFWAKTVLITVMLVPLIVELLNSAIERTVDMVTSEYHELAKYAKDAAAAAVMLSLIFSASVWICIVVYFW
jgi:diacylglycerol kinase (ATP)